MKEIIHDHIANAAVSLTHQHCGFNGGPKSRRTGEPCRGKAMPNGRCKNHGGKSHPPGLGHPTYKTGRFSKALPDRLAQKFQAAYDDPELLSMRSAVAILSTRIVEIAERFDAGGSGELWAQLLVQWTNLEHANTDARKHREAGDPDKAARAAARAGEALSAIGKLIQAGHSDEGTWRELVDAIKDMTGVAGAEHRRLLDLGQFMTASQAVAFVGALQQAVVETVAVGVVVDRPMLQKLGRRIDELLQGHQQGRPTLHATEDEAGGEVRGGALGDVVGALPRPLSHPEPVRESSISEHSPPAE